MRDIGPLVGAIDQGTTSTRFIVFSAVDGSMITYHQVPVQRSYPNDGWAEQRPQELFDSVLETTSVVLQKLADMQIDHRAIQCIGLANQRESAVVWDRVTGEPLYNCILWFDNRTAEIVDSVLDHIPGRDLNWLKEKTGLPLSTYFTAFKLKWLLKNVPAVKAALDAGTLLFGTVDSWLLWRLTGGQVHATDVTNASRTLLMDIETLQWDGELCRFFNIPPSILPTIHPSAHHYGEVSVGALAGLPLTAVIGDQNAALVGQQCFSIGQAKVTYGTGCFLIQNIGPGPLHGALKAVPAEAKKQLIITVAYQFGGRPACYAVEGSVATAGALITWLCKELKLVEDYKSIEPIALQENNSGGVFFVPALQGLFAPYWDLNATGTIIGLSSSTTRSHVVRAALEGVAYQANDVLSMMQPSGGTVGIRVDGGMACNDLLCQFLADISGSRIIRPQTTEATALGAAIVAGYTKRLWPELESHIEDYMGAAGGQSKGEVDLHELFYGQAEGAAAAVDSNGNFLNGATVSANGAASSGLLGQLTRGLTLTNGTASESGKRPSLQARIFEQSQDVFEPSLDEDLRLNRISTWRKAVERSLKWVKVEKQEQRKENYKRLSTLPFMIYVLVSFGTTILSQMVVSR